MKVESNDLEAHTSTVLNPRTGESHSVAWRALLFKEMGRRIAVYVQPATEYVWKKALASDLLPLPIAEIPGLLSPAFKPAYKAL